MLGRMILGVMVISTITVGSILYVQAKPDTLLKPNVQSYQEIVSDCVKGYAGHDVSWYDWDMARDRDAKVIASDVGTNENVILDCQGKL